MWNGRGNSKAKPCGLYLKYYSWHLITLCIYTPSCDSSLIKTSASSWSRVLILDHDERYIFMKPKSLWKFISCMWSMWKNNQRYVKTVVGLPLFRNSDPCPRVDIQTGSDELFFNFACARYHLFDFYIPDDQTRVVLRRRCDRSESDYINANYIRASRLGGSSCSVQSSNESLNSVNCKSWHLPTWYKAAWFSPIIKNGSFLEFLTTNDTILMMKFCFHLFAPYDPFFRQTADSNVKT